MPATITTEHPDYIRLKPRRVKMNDALGDEDDVKDKGDVYLPRTGGMRKNDTQGEAYDAYKKRARFPEITTQALTAMTGLIFENDPIGVTEDIITNAGQSNVEFARDVTRAVASQGRDILVVDAPTKDEGGGEPFIARYSAESLINWKTMPGKPSVLRLAVFKEKQESEKAGEYGHDTVDIYRQYKRIGDDVEISRWQIVEGAAIVIGKPFVLPVKFTPIITVGSIDSVPDCDPIPLLPVARCALAYYRKSADYEDALHRSGQPTPWVSGISQAQYDAILEQGIGSSALWYLGDSNETGKAGFLESGTLGREHREAMQEELKQAESHAVRLSQGSDTPESGIAITKRAAAQHASIYTIADSVSIAVTQAQRMRAIWAGEAEPEDFKLDAKISEAYAGEQMINALNSAVNSGNAPQSSVFEAIRKAGLSELDDDAMRSEIDTQGGLTLSAKT